MIHLPCRKCGGLREHFGTGVCWDCMGPAEQERFGDWRSVEAVKRRVIDTLQHGRQL